MASILLKKDYNDQKAGTIISVPFGVGKVLIRDGIGVRPAEADVKTPPHGPGGKGTEVKGAEVPKFPPQPTPSSPSLTETKKK